MLHHAFRFGAFFASLILLAHVALAQQADEDNPVPKLLSNLESENVRIAASAARSLGVIFTPGEKEAPNDYDAVAEKLIAKLDSPAGAKLREESARALGRMQVKSSLEGIKAAIDDEDIQVAIAAAEAATGILPVDEARSFLKTRGTDESQQVKAAVYQALANIAKPEDADFLAAGLSVNNWRVQEGAVQGLEKAVRAGATLAPEVYDGVAHVLGAETLNAANAAMHFLTHIRNDETLRATIAAIDTYGDESKQDESWRTRSMALRTIHHIGWPTNRTALPAVIRQLGDPIANVSTQARNVLIHLKNERYVSQQDLFPILLTELEKCKNLERKSGIMREMGSRVDRQYASRVAQAASKALLEAADEKSQWPARTYATRLVGASGYTGEINAVAKGVADDVSNVRQAAGQALAALAPLVDEEQSAAVAAILHPLLINPVDWRKTATAAAASGYYPTPDAVKPLVSLLSHSVINVKAGSSDALSQFAAGENAEIKQLVKAAVFAELSTNPNAWEFGTKVLGSMNDPEAVPLLISILRDGNWRAQANAANATKVIAQGHDLGSKELSDALVKAAQSEVIQVQDAADNALREIKQP